jgi:AI-2 transport protein TqsA
LRSRNGVLSVPPVTWAAAYRLWLDDVLRPAIEDETMGESIEPEIQGSQVSTPQTRRRGIDLAGSWIVFKWLVVAAAAWFLLKELAPILRPLLLAILLAYAVLPVRIYVTGQGRAGVRHLALLIGVCLVLVGLFVLAYGNVIALSREVPSLHHRAGETIEQATRYVRDKAPWLQGALAGTASAEQQGASRLQDALTGLANVTAGALLEAIAVAFFLILILLEARKFPERVRSAPIDAQTTSRLLAMFGSINEAIASYLKVKVKASLFLAIPATFILWVFGIKFVVLWGMLTFLANFIPYLGSIVSCSLPILFGFLDLDFSWELVAAAILLPALHLSSAYLIEPAMTGKAVNLSPLVVLMALSFWGLCWGMTGMILAVPLTSILKIVLESNPNTRPIGWLMGE